MTTTKIAETLLSNQNLYIGRTYSCIECSRGQKWHSKRRFKR